MCLCVYVCVCTYVCVGVRAYVCVCVRVRAVGRKETIVWPDPPGFLDSVLCEKCLPHVHNDY